MPNTSDAEALNEPFPDRDTKRVLTAALRHIEPDKARAVSLRAFRGFTFRQLGEALGMSKHQASQLHKQALKQLREYFAVRRISLRDVIG